MGLEVNKRLLPLKAHFYLFNAGTAPVVPFVPTLARQLGYSPSIVGLIYLILPMIGMLAKPIFGAIGDKYHKQKFLFLLFQFLIVISFASILLIPSIPARSEFHCHEGENALKFCPPNLHQIDDCTVDSVVHNPSNATFDCQMKCQKNDMWSSICGGWNIPGLCSATDKRIVIDTQIANNKITRNEDCFYLLFHNGSIHDQKTSLYCPGNKTDAPIFKMDCDVKCNDDTVTEVLSGATDEQAKSTYQFWMFFILLMISWSGMAVVVSVGDAICFEMLGDKPQRYGHQRLWGSIGWGSLSIISGLLIDKFSEGQTAKNYAVGFYIMAILIVLDMIVSSKLKYSQTKMSTNILRDVGQIFTSVRVVVFFLWCIVVGFGTAMIWNFLFWHLEDLGAQEGCNYGDSMKTLQGLVMGIQCFGGELPFFFLSGKILKKIGHVNAMSLVLFGFGVRFFCYSVLKNPWYVLPIELLNGVTFGIFIATMVSYASIVSPTGTEATMQGLVGAVFEGIGVSTGSFVGGKLMETYQGSHTFRLFSYGAFIFFIIHVAVQFLITKCIGPYGKNSAITDSADNKLNKNPESDNKGKGQETLDDGFKEIDLKCTQD